MTNKKAQNKAQTQADSRLPASLPPSVVRYVRCRRVMRWGAVVLIVVGLSLLSWTDHRGWFLYQGGELGRYDDQVFEVLRVIDGDTLDIVAVDGDQRYTRIRMWGVDTPEIGWEGREPEPYSNEASQFSKQLVQGKMVELDLEPHRVRGVFGRVLAYVILEDGTVLNERLLLEGLATADDRWPHRAMERYELLEEEARKNRVGLWGD